MVGAHRPNGGTSNCSLAEAPKELERYRVIKLEDLDREAANIRFKNGPSFGRSKFNKGGQSVTLWLANPTPVLDVGVAKLKSLTTDKFFTAAAGDVATVRLYLFYSCIKYLLFFQVEEQHYEQWVHSVQTKILES